MEQIPDAQEFADMVLDTMARMDRASRDALVEMLRAHLLPDFLDAQVAPGELRCPECGSGELVRNGHTRKKTQRWICKDCGRTRCAGSGSIMLNTKLPYETWYEYIPLFVDHVPSPKVAERLHVQQRTAWFMRIRVLEALFKNLPAFQAIAGSGVQVDEIYFRESFKGTRFGDLEEPPREPRGGKSEGTVKRGINNDQICVVTGVDDAGQFLYDVVCRGPLTVEAAKGSLDGRIDSGAIVVTDRHRAYPRALEGIGAAFHEAVSSGDHEKLERINHIHSAIRTFMAPFRGVSTKWLHLYLCWFKWLRCYARDGPGIRACLKQVVAGTYDHTYRDIQGMGLPFRDARMRPLKYATC